LSAPPAAAGAAAGVLAAGDGVDGVAEAAAAGGGEAAGGDSGGRGRSRDASNSWVRTAGFVAGTALAGALPDVSAGALLEGAAGVPAGAPDAGCGAGNPSPPSLPFVAPWPLP